MNMCRIPTSLRWWQNSVKSERKKGSENFYFSPTRWCDDSNQSERQNMDSYADQQQRSTSFKREKKTNISLFLFFPLCFALAHFCDLNHFKKWPRQNHIPISIFTIPAKNTLRMLPSFFNSFSPSSSHFIPFRSQTVQHICKQVMCMCVLFSCLPTQSHSQHMHVCSLLMNWKKKHTILCANGISGIVLARFFCLEGVKRINTHHWNVDELNFVRRNSKESIWPIVRLSL